MKASDNEFKKAKSYIMKHWDVMGRADVLTPDADNVMACVQENVKSQTSTARYTQPRISKLAVGIVCFLAVAVLTFSVSPSAQSLFRQTFMRASPEQITENIKYYIKNAPAEPDISGNETILYTYNFSEFTIKLFVFQDSASGLINKDIVDFTIEGLALDGASYADCYIDEDGYYALIKCKENTLIIYMFDGGTQDDFIDIIKRISVSDS